MHPETKTNDCPELLTTGDPESRHLRQCLREARVVVILYLSGLAWTLVVVIGWGYVPVEERPAVLAGPGAPHFFPADETVPAFLERYGWLLYVDPELAVTGADALELPWARLAEPPTLSMSPSPNQKSDTPSQPR